MHGEIVAESIGSLKFTRNRTPSPSQIWKEDVIYIGVALVNWCVLNRLKRAKVCQIFGEWESDLCLPIEYNILPFFDICLKELLGVFGFWVLRE